jgi:hypothetical protein
VLHQPQRADADDAASPESAGASRRGRHREMKTNKTSVDISRPKKKAGPFSRPLKRKQKTSLLLFRAVFIYSNKIKGKTRIGCEFIEFIPFPLRH